MTIYATPRIDEVFYSPKLYLETFGWVLTKEEGPKPFLFQELQDKYYDYLIENYWQDYRDDRGYLRGRFFGVREVNAKARQFGLSTLISGLLFHDTITNEGANTAIYCHKQEDSEAMLDKHKFLYQQLPEQYQPEVDHFNDEELSFTDLLSSVTAQTPAGSKKAQRGAGRSRTRRNLHASEFAEWPNPRRTMLGLMGSIPKRGLIFIESSPNLIGDYFHILYEQGKTPHSIWNSNFWPWYWFKEYNDPLTPAEEAAIRATLTDTERDLMQKYNLGLGHISWRRFKISELGNDELQFMKDFPEDDVSCFESGAELVFPRAARKVRVFDARPLPDGGVGIDPVAGHVYCIGVDVALGIPGRDYSAISIIDAHTLEQVYEWHGYVDPTDLADMVYRLWLRYPGLVGIEANGIGLTTIKFSRKIKDQEPWASNTNTWYSRFLFNNNASHGGWLTNESNKGAIIFLLKRSLMNSAQGDPGIKLCSPHTVRELGWFQHLPGGGMGAPGDEKEEGERLTDDSVMATAIAAGLLEFVPLIEDPYRRRFGSRAEDPKPEDKELWIPAKGTIKVK